MSDRPRSSRLSPPPPPLPPSSSSSSSARNSTAWRAASRVDLDGYDAEDRLVNRGRRYEEDRDELNYDDDRLGRPAVTHRKSQSPSDRRSERYRDRDSDWDRDRARDRDRDRDRERDRDRADYRTSDFGRDHDRYRDAEGNRRSGRDWDRPESRYPPGLAPRPPSTASSHHRLIEQHPTHQGGVASKIFDAGEDQEESPPPDEDLLAYIRSQQAASGSSKLDAETEKLKMERFQQGASTRKSRYQKEKEESERKKKQEEEEAAKAYKDFLAAMDGDDAARGGTERAEHLVKPRGFVSAGGLSSYQGSRPPPTSTPALKKPSMAGFDDMEDEESLPEKPKKEPPGKRKRAMDDFLGELQRDQAEREERLRSRIGEGASISSLIALEGQKVGSRDLGDPMTTNICVMNLPANISEDSLGEFFSQWGDVGTVKIMWPRGEEAFGGAGAGITNLRKDKSAGLTGFVAYMRREDANFALKETDGIRWGGTLIKTGWSKAMPLPSRAAYVMPVSAKRDLQRADSPSAPAHLRASTATRSQRASKLIVKHRRTMSPNRRRSPSPRGRVRMALTEQESKRRLIETVANGIRERGLQGFQLEETLREKAKDDVKFAFFRDEASNEYQYYRMCLDDKYEPDLPPLPFNDSGNDSLYSTDTGEESETEKLRKLRKESTLGPLASRRFEAMLRGLTPRRERVAKVMAFALEHAFAADLIAEILCASVLQPATPIPRKLARLHAISDILHNSAAPLPHAWKYRQAFETRLAAVFAHLREVRCAFPGRMKQEAVRSAVLAVLAVWEDWLVFSGDTLRAWKSAFEAGKGKGVKAATEGEAAEQAEVEVDLDGEEMRPDDEGKEDLDGEALDGAVADPAAAAAAAADAGPAHRDADDEDLDGEAM